MLWYKGAAASASTAAVAADTAATQQKELTPQIKKISNWIK